MKLVLLPGMDGTGELFSPLLEYLSDLDVVVIPLPQSGPQDYETLVDYVFQRLPSESFVLVAESFSGGIAARLSSSGHSHLKGIIFVASFLHSPAPVLATMASWLPIQLLARLPLSSLMLRRFFLGVGASDGLIDLFRDVIRRVPTGIMRARLKQISMLRFCEFSSSLPVVYLAATGDRLVGRDQVRYFSQAYAKLTRLEIDGPHFILQAQPEKSAIAVKESLSRFETR